MKRINERLAGDADFERELKLATQRFLVARDGSLSGRTQRHPGGGPDRVKCLHAHLAHYLVTGDNPVGRLVLEELSKAGALPNRPCV